MHNRELFFKVLHKDDSDEMKDLNLNSKATNLWNFFFLVKSEVAYRTHIHRSSISNTFYFHI